MSSGHLFRYGETGAAITDAALLERDFARLIGRSYAIAFNSCGASLAVGLRASGVTTGDDVLMNAFTLAPVPGAIAHVGANPILVEIDENYCVDLDSLRRSADATGAKHFLLSYMRGHIPDMNAVLAICEERGITVIEDCAHTMGATWAGRPTGSLGTVGCFSTQTFKHANSGEGGLLVTDDPDIAAQAVLLSGSYMLYEQHGAAPNHEHFERHRLTTPNWSMRMSALAAALVHPQLELLPERAAIWRRLYHRVAHGLRDHPGLHLPARLDGFVPSSIQFTVLDRSNDDMQRWLGRCADHGLHIKWFGADEPVGFTSRFDHWRYADEQSLAATLATLRGLCDIRLPLSLTDADCDTIAAIVTQTLDG